MVTTDQDAPPQITRKATRAEARRGTTQLRNALVRADNLLKQAFDEDWHEALGYGSGLNGWRAYCEKELPALRMLRISKAERNENLRLYRSQGMTEAALSIAFDIPAATIHRIVKDVDVVRPLKSLDGKTRSAVATPRPVVEAAPAPAPAPRDWPPAYPSYQRVADVVAAAGTTGMTYLEVANAIPWRDSQTSTALSKAAKRGLVTRSGSRDGCTVWVKSQVSGE